MKMTRAQWRAIARQTAVLLKQGQTVSAIKYLRERTGCGLKEAYDAVQELRKAHDLLVKK